MKVSLKLDNEESFSITVPDNSTVEDLKIASMVALPPQKLKSATKIKLWYSGKSMEFSSTLASYGITKDSKSTVYLTLSADTISDKESSATAPTATTAINTTKLSESPSFEIKQTSTASHPHKKRTKSKTKTKCSFDHCNSAPLRMVGDCAYCQGKFCSKHRLLESHKCKGLQNCKDKSYERNALKLQSEQTVASKV